MTRAQVAVLDTEVRAKRGAQAHSDHAERRLRRVSAFVILYLLLQAELGLAWDRNWHDYLGRDQFWIPPHILIYSGFGAAGIVALIVVLMDSRRYRQGKPGVDDSSTFAVLGFHAPLGYFILGYGACIDLVAAPLDNYWHQLYGIDVTLWAPFHIMGTIGGLVGGIGILYIFASEAAVIRERRVAVANGPVWRRLNAAEWGALVFFAGIIEIVLPALTAFAAFPLGDWQLVSYPLPLACAVGFSLIGAVQLTRRPGAATLTALLLWVLSAITQLYVPLALHIATQALGLSFRPSAGTPMFNITLALLPLLVVLEALIVDGFAFWQWRKSGSERPSLRWGWLIGALLSLVMVFLPVLLVHMITVLLPEVAIQKDILSMFVHGLSWRSVFLSVPFALALGAGGAFLGAALGDIWRWNKR
jgi:hypothetical protein